ncbi:MAG: 3-isopropylmalate dehydratase small subunit [Elusimicrobiota bacterium]|jgi:3-isopropylmalate/(R)-2-methylmalate dehydratase small subunit|nr:3-isopropylmalate dehydratase small subunit [Elusimicrobiota bacterium]
MKFIGNAHQYGDNINTDEIIPARYLNIADEKELAKHTMEDIDINFLNKLKNGDIIVAGANFGCGSSREHAPLVIKISGVRCVIAETFARIFFRNAINIGLPIIELKGAKEKIKTGDKVEVDLEKGIIKNLSKNSEYKITHFPEFMQKLISAGGLMKYIDKKSTAYN